MNLELDIEILWHTDESRKLHDSGMEVNPDELERKTITFYSVDVISPYKWDDDNMFCKITAGGETWITPYEYEIVREMVSSAIKKSSVSSYSELYTALEFLLKEHRNAKH